MAGLPCSDFDDYDSSERQDPQTEEVTDVMLRRFEHNTAAGSLDKFEHVLEGLLNSDTLPLAKSPGSVRNLLLGMLLTFLASDVAVENFVESAYLNEKLQNRLEFAVVVRPLVEDAPAMAIIFVHATSQHDWSRMMALRDGEENLVPLSVESYNSLQEVMKEDGYELNLLEEAAERIRVVQVTTADGLTANRAGADIPGSKTPRFQVKTKTVTYDATTAPKKSSWSTNHQSIDTKTIFVKLQNTETERTQKEVYAVPRMRQSSFYASEIYNEQTEITQQFGAAYFDVMTTFSDVLSLQKVDDVLDFFLGGLLNFLVQWKLSVDLIYYLETPYLLFKAGEELPVNDVSIHHPTLIKLTTTTTSIEEAGENDGLEPDLLMLIPEKYLTPERQLIFVEVLLDSSPGAKLKPRINHKIKTFAEDVARTIFDVLLDEELEPSRKSEQLHEYSMKVIGETKKHDKTPAVTVINVGSMTQQQQQTYVEQPQSSTKLLSTGYYVSSLASNLLSQMLVPNSDEKYKHYMVQNTDTNGQSSTSQQFTLISKIGTFSIVLQLGLGVDGLMLAGALSEFALGVTLQKLGILAYEHWHVSLSESTTENAYPPQTGWRQYKPQQRRKRHTTNAADMRLMHRSVNVNPAAKFTDQQSQNTHLQLQRVFGVSQTTQMAVLFELFSAAQKSGIVASLPSHHQQASLLGDFVRAFGRAAPQADYAALEHTGVIGGEEGNQRRVHEVALDGHYLMVVVKMQLGVKEAEGDANYGNMVEPNMIVSLSICRYM